MHAIKKYIMKNIKNPSSIFSMNVKKVLMNLLVCY